jgi:hypothetical protein
MRRPSLILLASLLLGPLPLLAQGAGREAAADGPLKLYAYTLMHQRASEALAAIQPLLSGRGTVELRQTDNTLVVRDVPRALSSIMLVLQRFDHPAEPLRIEVTILRARRASFSPVLQEEPLPEPLTQRLRELLPYSSYRVLARTDLGTAEGEDVTYELGEGFGVRFRAGTVVDGTGLKLHGFRVTRTDPGGEPRSLIHGHLSLRLDRTFAMTLAGSEGSASALVVVLVPRLDREAE